MMWEGRVKQGQPRSNSNTAKKSPAASKKSQQIEGKKCPVFKPSPSSSNDDDHDHDDYVSSSKTSGSDYNQGDESSGKESSTSSSQESSKDE